MAHDHSAIVDKAESQRGNDNASGSQQAEAGANPESEGGALSPITEGSQETAQSESSQMSASQFLTNEDPALQRDLSMEISILMKSWSQPSTMTKNHMMTWQIACQ